MNTEDDGSKRKLKVRPRTIGKGRPLAEVAAKERKNGANASRDGTEGPAPKKRGKFQPSDAVSFESHGEGLQSNVDAENSKSLHRSDSIPPFPEPPTGTELLAAPASQLTPQSKAKTVSPEDFFRRIRVLAVKEIRLYLVLPIVIAAGAAVGIVCFQRGTETGRAQLLREQTKEKISISDDTLREINQSFEAMVGGRAAEAVGKFESLQVRHPHISSLTYLAALAAMRSGDIDRAEASAHASIAKHERVSDSLMLVALAQVRRGVNPKLKKLVDFRVSAEDLLRQSIAVDVANPYPFLDLAALLRFQNKNDAALSALHAASLRVQPIDTLPYVELTTELTKLSALSDWSLPEISRVTPSTTTTFPAAYLALRKGNVVKAKELLTLARSQTDPKLFHYLINDQAFVKYAKEPGMQEFFQK